MSDNLVFTIDRRDSTSKNKVRRMRQSGLVPGIVYGGDKGPLSISMSGQELSKAMQSDSVYSQIIDLKLGRAKQQVVIRDLQRNPVTDQVTHIDFLRIDEAQIIQVSIPIHFENEDQCVGVRLGGGIISHNLIEVEVSCLPGNLPEAIVVDVQGLELGQTLHISDLEFPENVDAVALMQGDTDRDIPVVSVQAPKGSLLDEEEVDEDELLEGQEGEAEDVDETSDEDE